MPKDVSSYFGKAKASGSTSAGSKASNAVVISDSEEDVVSALSPCARNGPATGR